MARPGTYDRSLSTQERRADQRRRLLFSAARVFAKSGWAGASVEAIVQDAGMSRRTFYEHFDDLAAALLEVHDASASIAVRQVASAMEGGGDPIARLERGIRAFLELVGANGDLARVLFRELRAAGPQYERRRQALLEKFGALVHAAIADAHAKKLLRRRPDELTVFAVTSAVEAVGMRYVEKREEARVLEAVPALLRVVTSPFA